METWKAVPYAPAYEVSNLGNIRRNGRAMGFYVDTSGRRRVTLHSGLERPLNRRLHTLVMEAFVGPRPDGMEVRHLNGDKLDNRLENLAYGTKSENVRDAIRHGTHWAPKLYGEQHGRCKVTDAQVAEIRRRAAPGQYRALALEYGLTVDHVRRLARGARRTGPRGV